MLLGDMRSENILGAILMMASMAAFTFNDALMKLLSNDWPFFQALFIRGVIAAIILAAIAGYRGFGWRALIGADWKLIIIRTLAEVAAANFFISALFNMPIANITAIIQALPLTVTLAGAVYLKEPIGWRRLAAIGVGGIGMLLIVRPGTASFDIYSFYGVMAVICVTVRDVVARRLAVRVPTLTVAFLSTLAIAMFGAAGSLSIAWAPITPSAVALAVGAAIFVVGGSVFSVQVMRQGDIGFIAPFRYTSLLWALVLGWFLFGDWPDFLTQVGALIIVTTGLYSFWREQLAMKAAP